MVRSLYIVDGAAVFLGVGIAVATLAAAPSEVISCSVAATLLFFVLWISVEDVRQFIIPDGPIVAIALIAASARLAQHHEIWPEELFVVLVDAILSGGALLAVREVYYLLRGHDGLGFGDVKLAAAGGILVGTGDFAWAIMAASMTGLALAFCAIMSGRRHQAAKLPFGALLAPACWLIWASGTVKLI